MRERTPSLVEKAQRGDAAALPVKSFVQHFRDEFAYHIEHKKCLVTGHFAPFSGTAYKKPIEDTWANRLGKRVLYVGGIGGLRSVSRREHDVYLLNYLPLDITLHQSAIIRNVTSKYAITYSRDCFALGCKHLYLRIA